MVQKDSLKPKIVIIAGPTASGKSALSIETALKFGGEIISADSMQIYKGLDIGTGKITKEEARGIKHHLIDIKEPYEEYSVNEFAESARKKIDEILKKGKLPIIAGGTGLYINGLINNYNFSKSPKSEEIRNKLKCEAEEKGIGFLYSRLFDVDPKSAKKISKNDIKRIIRALEIYEITSVPKSESETANESDYNYLFFVLNFEREDLYKKIEKRVDEMIDNGLIEEVEKFKRFASFQALQAIGYKEIIAYLSGVISKQEAIETIKRNTRHYAKRQITFFKSMKAEKSWVDPSEKHQIFDEITYFLSTTPDIV